MLDWEDRPSASELAEDQREYEALEEARRVIAARSIQPPREDEPF